MYSADFSPIPLESIKRQFKSYTTQDHLGTSLKSLSRNHTETYNIWESSNDDREHIQKPVVKTRNALDPSKLLKPLDSNTTKARDIERLSPIHRSLKSRESVKYNGDKSKGSSSRSQILKSKSTLDLEKEKVLMKEAGFSQKLSSMVFDEFNKKAEKISNELENKVVNESHYDKLLKLKEIENKFSRLQKEQQQRQQQRKEQLQQRKNNVRTNRYASIRRLKMLEDKQGQQKEKRKLSESDPMPRTEIEQELEDGVLVNKNRKSERIIKPISSRPATQMSSRARSNAPIVVTDANTNTETKPVQDAGLKRATDDVSSSNESDASDEHKTPTKEGSKRLSNVQISSASKRRKTLFGPREMPTSFKSPTAKPLDGETSDKAQIPKESTSNCEKGQEDVSMELANDSTNALDQYMEKRQPEALKPLEKPPIIATPLNIESQELPQETENDDFEQFLNDEKPVLPLRVSTTRSRKSIVSNNFLHKSEPINAASPGLSPEYDSIMDITAFREFPVYITDKNNPDSTDVSMMNDMANKDYANGKLGETVLPPYLLKPENLPLRREPFNNRVARNNQTGDYEQGQRNTMRLSSSKSLKAMRNRDNDQGMSSRTTFARSRTVDHQSRPSRPTSIIGTISSAPNHTHSLSRPVNSTFSYQVKSSNATIQKDSSGFARPMSRNVSRQAPTLRRSDSRSKLPVVSSPVTVSTIRPVKSFKSLRESPSTQSLRAVSSSSSLHKHTVSSANKQRTKITREPSTSNLQQVRRMASNSSIRSSQSGTLRKSSSIQQLKGTRIPTRFDSPRKNY